MQPALDSAYGGPALPRRKRAMRNVVLACVAVLLLGQLLIGALSLAALMRLGADSTADRLSLIAGRTAGQVQAGLNLGKPLTQYFGLSLAFERLSDDIPELQAAAFVLDDATVLASVGPDLPVARLLRELRQGAGRAREATADGLTLALPLVEPDGGRKGALVLRAHAESPLEAATIWSNLRFLAIVTALAAVVMALAMRWLPVQRVAAAGWLRLAVPVVIMLVAQAAYTVHTVQDFRSLWQSVIQQNAQLIGEGLERDLEKVLGYGFAPERMRGVERPMARAIEAFPLLGGMQFLSLDGRVLAESGSGTDHEAVLHFPLEIAPGEPQQASLKLYLDDSAMRAAVRARALDAATIAVVAMVAALELMLMLQVLMDRAFSARTTSAAMTLPGRDAVSVVMPDDPSRLGMVARPVMFAFLFAMALPLGFLPLYARSLVDSGLSDGATAMLVALPTAAEMAAGLFMALLAGRMI